MNTQAKKGFTLLELLIVIAVIAVLSAVLVIVINPTETLQKSRDSQRISDLATMKSAFGMYLTTTSSPQLAGAANVNCLGGASPKVYLSVPTSTASTTSAVVTGFTAGFYQSASVASSTVTDGTGWIPVNFNSITGGSPISNLPIDPTNTMSAAGSLTNSDLMYRYACKASPVSYEINAKLESTEYTTNDNRGSKDGGNNATLYEVGTDLTILPSTNDF